MHMKKIKVRIPNGYLMIEAEGIEAEYPGVYVSYSKDGKNYDTSKPIACIEYDTHTGEILTETYAMGRNNPCHIITYENGRDKIK